MTYVACWVRAVAVAASLVAGTGCRTTNGNSAVMGEGGHSMHMPAGIHGMVLFGTDTLYLSHLPLFSSPHDYQVILEVTLSADALAAYLADKQQGTAKIYTLNPVDQPFALAELTAETRPRHTFRGSVFHDHFEDGHPFAPLGFAIAEHALVTIKRVVYFQHFDPNAAALPALQYVLFGHASQRGQAATEWWAAHIVNLPPDFDQIIAVKPAPDAGSPDQVAAGIPLVFPGRANNSDARLKAGEQAAAQANQAAVNLDVVAETYLESGDLTQ